MAQSWKNVVEEADPDYDKEEDAYVFQDKTFKERKNHGAYDGDNEE